MCTLRDLSSICRNEKFQKSESLCKSPSVSSESKPDPSNSEMPAEVSNFEVIEDTQVSDPPISITTDTKTKMETQPIRRRQWGSRTTASTPSLSSESLEKLIPSSCWIRSKNTVIDNGNDEVSRTSPVSFPDTASHIDDLNEKCQPFNDDDDNTKEETNEFDHKIKNKLFTDHKNNHSINEEDSSNNSNNDNNNNSDRLHLEREPELEVDAVVENMDTYDDNNNSIEEVSIAYDSRTVHLTSSDISPKLDVIIKRGCVVNTTSTTTTTTNMTPSTTITIAAITTSINVNNSTITQSTNQMTTKIGEGLQSNSSYLTQASSNLTKKSPPPKRKGPKETKAVGYLVEPPERIEPMQPAKHPQTDIVYIHFLVRPFTAEQLRQMVVTHFGPVVDLWLDKIKSSSLIRLQTVEYAAKCRDGLDGSRWPSMNPRVLRCDYASTDLFEWMKVNGDSGDLQPPKHLLLGDASSSNADTSVVKADKSDNGFTTSTDQDKKPTDLRRKLERSNRDIEQPLLVTKSRQGENKECPITEAKPKSEEPAKLLNNLFRKTIATPSVYWLPLTSEQVNRRMKKSVADKPDAKKITSRHSSHQSEEAVQKTTRSPFANSSCSSTSPPSYPSGRIPSQSRRNPTSDRSSKPKILDAKSFSTSKSSSDNVRHNSTKKPVSSNVLCDSKGSTSESKLKSIRDSKGESRDIIADDNKQQGRSSKPDTSSNNSTLLKNDSSRKKEMSPSTHTRKRRYSKTDSDDKEAIPSKQSRPSLTSSGDSSVVGEALAAYKKNHTETQHHRSDHRRRSSSNRPSSPNHRSSFKSSFPEGPRVKDKTDSISHSRDSGRRRSRSFNQRHRSRSTDRRDRSSSNRYRSRR